MVAVKQKAVALSTIHCKYCVVDSDYMTDDRCTLHLCRSDTLSYLFLLTPLFYKYCVCVYVCLATDRQRLVLI